MMRKRELRKKVRVKRVVGKRLGVANSMRSGITYSEDHWKNHIIAEYSKRLLTHIYITYIHKRSLNTVTLTLGSIYSFLSSSSGETAQTRQLTSIYFGFWFQRV